MIEIATLQTVTPGDWTQLQQLFGQLSPGKTPEDIQQILARDNVVVMICREAGQIAGMASMACYQVLSGYKGWIEDVVVNEQLRGKGVGEQLIRALMAHGKQLGLTSIFLYTEDEKQAAVGLYRKLGFTTRNSRVYQLKNW